MLLTDNHGHQYDRNLTLGGAGCPQTVPPSTYLTFCKNGAALLGLTPYPGCGFEFGVGDNDEVNLYASTSHAVLIDTTGTACCAGVSTASFGRTGIDGTGAFAIMPIRTPGIANVWTVMISEIAARNITISWSG